MVVDARSERIEDVVELVADVVFGGGTVIFPHDTSYGIGCDPYHLDAVDRVYHAKGRPDQRPLTLQVASPAEFLEYARENALAILAAKRLLPGPITLVVRRPGFLSGELSAGLSTIGFRVPDAVLARAILDRCGPLAMSSANASGRPSNVATTAAVVESCTLNPSGCSQRQASASRHQRSEKPSGGNFDWFTALNETDAVITIGARINT